MAEHERQAVSGSWASGLTEGGGAIPQAEASAGETRPVGGGGQPVKGSRGVPGWVVALAIYLGLSLLALYPSWTAPGSHFPGDWRHPDCLSNHWVYQWVATQVSAVQSILHNDAYYFPVGDAPFLAGNATDAFFYLPFHLLLGWPVGVVFYALCQLCFGGLGTYWLCRRLGAGAPGAILAGAMLTFNPYLFHELSQGRLAQLPVVWLALFLGAFVQLLQSPTRGRGALAVVLYSVCAISYWYYGLFAALAGAILVVSRLFLGAEGLLAGLRTLWRALLGFAGGVLILVAPVLGLFFSHWEAIPGVQEAFPSHWAVESGRTLAWPLFEVARGDGRVVLPLAILVLAALAGWGKHRIREHRWLELGLLGVAGVFYLLSLGPYPKVGAAPLSTAWTLPYHWFYQLTPSLQRFWWPNRHVLVVQLALGGLAALGLTRLLASRPRASLVLACLLSLLLPLELGARGATVRIRQSRWQAPEVYRQVRAGPGSLLLELPLSGEVLTVQQSLIYQPIHGKRLFNGHAPWVKRVRPPGFDKALKENSFLAAILAYERGDGVTTLRFKREDLVALQGAGLRLVTVNSELYLESLKALYQGERTLLRALFGQPVISSEGFRAHDVAAFRQLEEVEVPPFFWPSGLPRGDGDRPLPGLTFPSLGVGDAPGLLEGAGPGAVRPAAGVGGSSWAEQRHRADGLEPVEASPGAP